MPPARRRKAGTSPLTYAGYALALAVGARAVKALAKAVAGGGGKAGRNKENRKKARAMDQMELDDGLTAAQWDVVRGLANSAGGKFPAEVRELYDLVARSNAAVRECMRAEAQRKQLGELRETRARYERLTERLEALAASAGDKETKGSLLQLADENRATLQTLKSTRSPDAHVKETRADRFRSVVSHKKAHELEETSPTPKSKRDAPVSNTDFLRIGGDTLTGESLDDIVKGAQVRKWTPTASKHKPLGQGNCSPVKPGLA